MLGQVLFIIIVFLSVLCVRLLWFSSNGSCCWVQWQNALIGRTWCGPTNLGVSELLTFHVPCRCVSLCYSSKQSSANSLPQCRTWKGTRQRFVSRMQVSNISGTRNAAFSINSQVQATRAFPGRWETIIPFQILKVWNFEHNARPV